MRNFETRLHPGPGGKFCYTVELVGKAGDVISVQLRQDAGNMINPANAIEKARELLIEAAAIEGGPDYASEHEAQSNGDLNDLDHIGPGLRSAGETGDLTGTN